MKLHSYLQPLDLACAWNSLPVQLRNPDITYGLFRRQLKGHLFREARTRRSVTSDILRIRKTYTYILSYFVTENTPKTNCGLLDPTRQLVMMPKS